MNKSIWKIFVNIVELFYSLSFDLVNIDKSEVLSRKEYKELDINLFFNSLIWCK